MVGSNRISNSSETLWLSLLSAKFKNIQSKMKALECSQHYLSIFQTPKADNSEVGGGIWPKFEHLQAFMHVLVTCKNEDDSIKKEADRVVQGRSRAANSAVLGPIWPNFELVRDFIVVIVT